VVIDSFSKWTEIFPLREARGPQIGKLLEEQLFCRFGMPSCLVSDNGTVFTSNILEYLCKQWGIHQRFISPYHAQSNLTERVNRTIKTMIRAYLDGQRHSKWSLLIPFLKFAINSSKQDSTGFSPAKVLLNKELSFPFDINIQIPPSEIKVLKRTAPKTQQDLIFDRQVEYNKCVSFVSEFLQKAKDHQKKYYDQRHRDDHFQVGDLVVLRDVTLSSKDDGVAAGLCPLYRSGVAKVSKVFGDLNYEVKFEDGSVKGPLHIQFLRRYKMRDAVPPPQSSPVPSTSVHSGNNSQNYQDLLINQDTKNNQDHLISQDISVNNSVVVHNVNEFNNEVDFPISSSINNQSVSDLLSNIDNNSQLSIYDSNNMRRRSTRQATLPKPNYRQARVYTRK
jgi:hypothetical protein